MNPDPGPIGPNVFVVAINWLQTVLLGNLATAVAIIAVGAFGLFLLSGRLRRRRGIEMIIGCFIIFGASTIATGLLGVMGGSASSQDVEIAQAAPFAPVQAAGQLPVQTVPYDPYAGAAMPSRP